MARNDALAEPHALLGQIHLEQKEHNQAITEGRRAVTLEPNGAEWHGFPANTLSYSGEAEEALVEIMAALLLNPEPPTWYPEVLARIFFT